MQNKAKSLVVSLLSALLLFACPSLARATEKQNELTDEQYAAFGLSLEDPDLFADESDPLESYEPTVLSELYVGSMNASGQSHYEGSFRVLNETDEASAAAFNVNAATRTLVGTQTALSNYDSGFQTQNTCAVDVDGDGQDEIAELVLYTKDKGDKSARQDMAVLSYYKLDGSTWKKGPARKLAAHGSRLHLCAGYRRQYIKILRCDHGRQLRRQRRWNAGDCLLHPCAHRQRRLYKRVLPVVKDREVRHQPVEHCFPF